MSQHPARPRRRRLLAAGAALGTLLVGGAAAPALAQGPAAARSGAAAQAVPAVASSTAWRDCGVTLAGVPFSIRSTQRTATIVKSLGGTYARVSFFVRTDTACGFTQLFSDGAARIGAGGMTAGTTRRQGTNTTPAGAYSMTESFGLSANPGSTLPYNRVVDGDYWVQDNGSVWYNTYRNKSGGAFRWWLPASDPNSSERLQDYPTQYAYAVVINFNRPPDARILYRGSGIFFHVRGSGATGGCIGISAAEVVTMLRNIKPGDAVTIAG